jgi:hypothetical protein
VFISLTEEPRTTVEPFLKRKPIKGWVALDTDYHASDAYGVTGIPHTFITGRDGRILGETHPSSLKAEHIEKALRGETLGPRSDGQGAEAEGATVAAADGKPTYGGSFSPGRFPAVGFDKEFWAPPGDPVQYRRLVEAGIGGAFGLAAHTEDRVVGVLLLTAATTGAPKLELTASTGGSVSSTRKEKALASLGLKLVPGRHRQTYVVVEKAFTR